MTAPKSRMERGKDAVNLCRVICHALAKLESNLDPNYTVEGSIREEASKLKEAADKLSARMNNLFSAAAELVTEAAPPPMPKTVPMFGASPKKNIFEGKPHFAPLSDEDKALQEERHAESLRRKEEEKAQAKKQQRKLLDEEEEKEVEEKRTRQEIIREVVSTHPEFESVFAFVSYLNENDRDAYSPTQLAMLVKLHHAKPEDLKAGLAAAGKYEMRMDRKVRTPSEVIQTAAEILGKTRQEVFEFLHRNYPKAEDVPLSVNAITRAMSR